MRGGDGGKQEQQAAIAATPLGTTFAVNAEVAPRAGGEPALCDMCDESLEIQGSGRRQCG